MPTSLPMRLRGLRADERGAVSIETTLILPILVFLYLMTYAYFDAYRQQGLLTKAGYAAADMLSRQTAEVGPDDMEGLRNIVAFMSASGDDTWLRISEIEPQGPDQYDVRWSYATGGNMKLRESYVPRIAPKLPELASGERIVVVETFTLYEPPFSVGIPNEVLHTVSPARSRYGGPLAWNPDL